MQMLPAGKELWYLQTFQSEIALYTVIWRPVVLRAHGFFACVLHTQSHILARDDRECYFFTPVIINCFQTLRY